MTGDEIMADKASVSGVSASLAMTFSARPATDELCRVGPICGENYDLFLCDGGRILSAPGGVGASMIGERLDAHGIAQERLEHMQTLRHRGVCEGYATMMGERVLLLFPLDGPSGDEWVGILPHVPAASIGCVLAYSFGQRLEIDERVRAVGGLDLRPEDEDVYLYLEQLLAHWRRLVGGQTVFLADRRALSHELIGRVRLLEHFLGWPPLLPGMQEFPFVYPFRGNFDPAATAWMLLLLVNGARRCLGHALESAHVVPDYERLLPMIECSVGNRTPLPSEWEMCRQKAAEVGMLFEVRRSRAAVRIFVCPLKPAIDPSVFYSLRAPASLVLQLRAKYEIKRTEPD